MSGEYLPTHCVQGLLQRETVHLCKRLQEYRPDAREQPPVLDIGAGVPPSGGDLGGEDPVVRFGQRRVRVPRESAKFRSG